VVDVVIGGLIGLAAVFIYPPRPRPERFEAALSGYRDAIMQTLRAVGEESGTYAIPLVDGMRHDYVGSSRGLRSLADKARDVLVPLVESAHLNLRDKGVDEQFEDQAERLRRLTGIGVQVRGIVGAASRMYDRPGAPTILTVGDLRQLVDGEIGLMSVVLGSSGEPVRGTDHAVAERRDRDLGETMRVLTDAIVSKHEDATLPAVSLIGRFDHIRLQLAEFPGWEV